ncbi:metallophosphoesterase [Massilia sp. GCM10020059]|uniref:Metallophosphoesterase n=1 Tax=Massilia agrisoli TaxID=2892444 RepID=A0ABS8IV53_9BURK|nr:metallophosphoesterase [Massilia agrisoli]MCC6072336.1 metallophosphoesterase [Massilia agrisoli]
MPPSRVIFMVVALSALLHLYVGMRLLPAVEPEGVWLAAVYGLLAVSALLVPAGLLASGFRRLGWSDQLSWAGMLAMGMFSSLLVLTVLRDVTLLILALIGGAGETFDRGSAIAVPLLALAATLAGFFNARRLARVVEVDVPIPGLPKSLHGYSIAQISDVHIGPTIKRSYLEAIVARVNGLKPDAIAITGDLVDGSVQRLAAHTAPLASLSAPDGAFFVTGNHEYYSGASEWIAELRRLGLTVLINEHVVRERGGDGVMIAGVTDYTAHHFDPSHRSDPRAAAAHAPSNVKARLLLAHQPRSAEAAAAAGFDLQLSGHTHGGQFYPWNLFVPLQQPFTAGLNQAGAMWVYTSRGTGYWGPPKRFGAPSEITLLRLVAA